MISSTGETHASNPETQSDLMNYHSEFFIQIDTRKWNYLPACEDVVRKSLEWKITKLGMHLIRHCDVADRETDGGVHWSSMCPKLRRAKARKPSPIPMALDYIHTGSNKTRFQYCKNSNDVIFV